MIYVHFTNISVGVWPKNKNICNSILNLPAILGKKNCSSSCGVSKKHCEAGGMMRMRIKVYSHILFAFLNIGGIFLSKDTTASSPQNPVVPIQSIKHNPALDS